MGACILKLGMGGRTGGQLHDAGIIPHVATGREDTWVSASLDAVKGERSVPLTGIKPLFLHH